MHPRSACSSGFGYSPIVFWSLLKFSSDTLRKSKESSELAAVPMVVSVLGKKAVDMGCYPTFAGPTLFAGLSDHDRLHRCPRAPPRWRIISSWHPMYLLSLRRPDTRPPFVPGFSTLFVQKCLGDECDIREFMKVRRRFPLDRLPIIAAE
jgi:hypothetical protein